jgi:hypothetical protein
MERDCIRVLEAVRLSSIQALAASSFPSTQSYTIIIGNCIIYHRMDISPRAPIYTVSFQGAGASQTQ